MRIIDWSSDVCSSDLPGAAAPEPALQRLVHRRVVVARLDPGDVVAPVLAAHRAVGVEYHARGHRGLAHGVADVEALDARRQVGQADRKSVVSGKRVSESVGIGGGGTVQKKNK